MRADLNLVSVQLSLTLHSKNISKVKSSDHQGCLILGLAVWHSIGHLSVECLTKHSISNLVCRICNILSLGFSTDSLNLPMLFLANLVDMMSNSLHIKIIYCR